MLKIQKLVAFLILTSIFTIAQAQINEVHLVYERSPALTHTNFYIDEIIDNRLNKFGIGIIQETIYNHKTIADFSKPIELEVMELLKRLLPADNHKTPLTLRINEAFIIEETRAFSEDGMAYVIIDMLQKNDAGTYHYLGSYSTIITNENFSLDVSKKHGERMSKAFTTCLEQFQADFSSGKFASRPQIQLPIGKQMWNGLQKKKAGFFISFTEFYNGITVPSNSLNIAENTEKDFTEKVFITDKHGNHCNFFAYYDGENFYLNAKIYSKDEYFIRTHRIGDLLFFNERMSSEIFLGKSGMTNDTKRGTYFFNMVNGQFHGISKKMMKDLLRKKYPVLYKNYLRKGKKDIYTIKEIFETLLKKEDWQAISATLTSQ